MSKGGGCCGSYVVLFVCLIAFLTVTSPVFLVYGAFSGEWLIEDPSVSGRNGTSLSKATRDDKIYYGLNRKCHTYMNSCSNYVLDETTFWLEVTSVLFQFLAILALPWLKPCIPDNKCLKHWNYCFIPFLFVAAILSLCASSYFWKKFGSKKPYLTIGASVKWANQGGLFQIVLACIITYFLWRHKVLCFQTRPSTNEQMHDDNQTMVSTIFKRTGIIFVTLFSFRSIHVSVDGETVVTEGLVVVVDRI